MAQSDHPLLVLQRRTSVAEQREGGVLSRNLKEEQGWPGVEEAGSLRDGGPSVRPGPRVGRQPCAGPLVASGAGHVGPVGMGLFHRELWGATRDP